MSQPMCLPRWRLAAWYQPQFDLCACGTQV